MSQQDGMSKVERSNVEGMTKAESSDGKHSTFVIHHSLWAWGIGLLIVAGLAGALAAATLPRLKQQRELREAAERKAEEPPRVPVATVHRAPPTQELTLPANAQPFRGALSTPASTAISSTGWWTSATT